MLSIAEDTAELTPVFNPSANLLFAFSITCSFIVSTSWSFPAIIWSIPADNVLLLSSNEETACSFPADTPVFYSGLKSIDSTDGHCRSSLSWFNAVISVHLLCPKPSLRLKMMAALHQSLAKDEEIIMFDDSPMVVKALKMNNNADYLREGQMSLTGYYACLKDAFKQPGISGVTINDLA